MLTVRLFGAAAAFCAISAAGFYAAGASKARVREISSLKASLIILKSEINYGLSALEAAALVCVNRGGGGAARFFAKLAQNLCEGFDGGVNKTPLTADAAWQNALPALGSAFDNDDREALAHIGRALGRLDKDAQTEAIDMAIEYINAKTAVLNDAALCKGRLYPSVGVICGLMAGIALI